MREARQKLTCIVLAICRGIDQVPVGLRPALWSNLYGTLVEGVLAAIGRVIVRHDAQAFWIARGCGYVG